MLREINTDTLPGHLHDRIYGCGVHQFGFVNPAEMEYHRMVRDICEGNMCRMYGKSWACPPGIGTLEECRARCFQYDTMMVFSGLCFLEDSFDLEGMQRGMADFKVLAKKLEKILTPHIGGYLMLSNEGCDICPECTYPDAPCRFPKELHHSIEGYGFLVSELAKHAGIEYNNGKDTVTYFGAVLFQHADVK